MLPCYNASATLRRAIVSVLAQTFADWELIVVDDGSTDSPERVLAEFPDPRIRVHRSELNQGRAAARQLALERATGTYLTFLDSDDWLYPVKLARQVEVLERHPDIAIVSSLLALVDDHGHLIGRTNWSSNSNGQWDRGLVGPFGGDGLDMPRFHYVAAMVRRAGIAGLAYRVGQRRSEDLAFFVEATINRQYAILLEPLYVYTGWDQLDVQVHLDSLRCERQIFWGYRMHYRRRAALLAGTALAKSAAYRLLEMLHQTDRVLRRRHGDIDGADRARHARACARVARVARQYGGAQALELTGLLPCAE